MKKQKEVKEAVKENAATGKSPVMDGPHATDAPQATDATQKSSLFGSLKKIFARKPARTEKPVAESTKSKAESKTPEKDAKKASTPTHEHQNKSAVSKPLLSFKERLKALFTRKPKDLDKIARKNLTLAQQVAARDAKKRPKKRLTTQQKRRNLSDYFNKAGYFDVNLAKFKRRIFFIAINVTVTAWGIPFIMALINSRPLLVLIPFTIAMWTAFIGFIWLLLWGAVYFYLEMRMYTRTKELEKVLPDFLQLTSANISAGMPIDRALWLAIRPSFGVLAKEIEDVAKATLSGEDLSDSLKKFVDRYDSTVLKRSISILLEGLESGGELADLLNKIALNIQELEIMKKEMAANVTTYAIFISFASIGIAPILFALATQLVVIIIGITAGLDLGGASSSIAISTSSDPEIVNKFTIYSYAMLAVTAGMSAAIIAVIRRGNIRDGIRNIPIYIAVSLLIYTFASSLLAVLLSGFF